jgi:hypothetical protein
MTGSSWAPIIIPIVVACVLAVWLGLVFYADARPGWKAHPTALGGDVADTGPGAGARERTERQEVTAGAPGSPAAADRGTGEPAPAPPHRRAA